MSTLKRFVSPGRLLAFALSLVVVYYAWGFVFTPGGTGSNVVLGLLLACAAIYLLTTNLGPLLDDNVFARGAKEVLQLVRFAESTATEVNRALARDAEKKKPTVDEVQRAKLAGRLGSLRAALSAVQASTQQGETPPEAAQALRDELEALERESAAAFGNAHASVFSQLRSLGIAFAVALGLRAFVVEPFQIPSSSMIPTLQIGDHLFVARFLYGLQMPFGKDPSYLVRWGVPEPGDVVVFVAPPYVGANAGDDWIKRVIAGPGQRVRLVDTVLYVDDMPYAHVGEPERETYRDYDELSRRWSRDSARHVVERIGDAPHSMYLSPGTMRSWPEPGGRDLPGLDCDDVECTVGDGHVFVMGDNRDRSSDGRRWGAVPIDNVKGKALFIWMSVDGSERSVDLGRFTLPRFRWDRLFDGID